jgi:ketosteroid isomerase-like protein
MTSPAERIRHYFEACNTGEGARIAQHFIPDAVVYDTNHAPIVGRDTIGQFFEKIVRKWAGAQWSVDRMVDDGTAAAIEWSMTGTKDGQPFTFRGSEHYSFEDGLIKEIRQYWTFDPNSPGSELHGFDYETWLKG